MTTHLKGNEMTANRPVAQDTINRLDAMRERVFQGLEQAKTGTTIVITEARLAELWALLGNASHVIGNLETEIRETLYRLDTK